MSVKITLNQLRDQLPELLDRVVNSGEEYVVQRNGQDCAVIIDARHWRRCITGKRLDAAGPDYRLARTKQSRAEALLAAQQVQALTALERRELRKLLRECDAILARRTARLDRLS